MGFRENDFFILYFINKCIFNCYRKKFFFVFFNFGIITDQTFHSKKKRKMENSEITLQNIPLYKTQLLDKLSCSQHEQKGDLSGES
jgi:hypothetical protein